MSAHEEAAWELYLRTIDPDQADYARVSERAWLNCDQAWQLPKFRAYVKRANGDVMKAVAWIVDDGRYYDDY